MIIAPKEITIHNVYIEDITMPPKGYVRKLNGQIVHGDIVHSNDRWMWAWRKVGDYIYDMEEVYELDKNSRKMFVHIQKMREHV